MLKVLKGVPCIACCEIMDGVYDFSIRKVCSECGGEALPVETRKDRGAKEEKES